MSPLWSLKKSCTKSSACFFLILIKIEGFIAGFFGLFIFVVNDAFLYLLISNSLMNKLDNGNRQKKNQVHVCPWRSSVSHLLNILIIETWELTSTFSLNGGTWFPFTMKLSYLKTLILMREKMVPRLSSYIMGSNSLPLQG